MFALVFFEIVLFSMLFAVPLQTVQHPPTSRDLPHHSQSDLPDQQNQGLDKFSLHPPSFSPDLCPSSLGNPQGT